MNMNLIIRSGAFKLDGHSYRYVMKYDDEHPRNGRAYVFGPGDDLPTDELERLAEQLGVNSIYTRRGDYPKLDRAWDRYNREIVAAKRRVLDVALFLAEAHPETEVKFSRKAGCSCGCSPGFILKGLDQRTLYVTRKDAKVH